MDDPKKVAKISDIIDGLPRLKVYDAELSKFEKENPFEPQFSVVDKNTYLGIEIEVENVQRWTRYSPYWSMIEDGSLRNSGREFITPPIRAWRVEHALAQLFNRQLNQDIDFSERTSVHIHMNVRTLTVEQLESLVITYLVFERSLFNFIEKRRFDNIFCVPLCETSMGTQLHELILNHTPRFHWQKYTALNLLPISQKGTIEFRHLQGTKDIKKIMTWINFILCLKKFALRNDPEYVWHRVQTLNTSSEYRMFGEEVFGGLVEEIFTPSFNKEVERGIIYIKNHCVKNNFRYELIGEGVHEKSPLFKYRFNYRLGSSLRDQLDIRQPDPEESWEDEYDEIVQVDPNTWLVQPTIHTTGTGNWPFSTTAARREREEISLTQQALQDALNRIAEETTEASLHDLLRTT